MNWCVHSWRLGKLGCAVEATGQLVGRWEGQYTETWERTAGGVTGLVQLAWGGQGERWWGLIRSDTSATGSADAPVHQYTAVTSAGGLVPRTWTSLLKGSFRSKEEQLGGGTEIVRSVFKASQI